MKKNLARAFALCSIMAITLSACGQETPEPDELNENVVEYTESLGNEELSAGESDNSETTIGSEKETTTGSSSGKEEKSSSEAAKENADQEDDNSDAEKVAEFTAISDQEETNVDQNSAQKNSILTQAADETVYPISEETKTYIDLFGIQTIEKKYVVPYYADIRDIAPATITTNNVQYGIDSIQNPQTYEEKKVVRDQVAKTEEEAKRFPDEIEYDETDGKGVLTLDVNSVKTELNKDEKIPSAVSVTKTYNMKIKDQDQIPQTIKSNGITYYQSNVSWKNMGDPGTGINGTEGENGYGTYNTVASSWQAVVTYGGTKYTEDKDYKGTAVYVGKILANNSPSKIFVVTYKPNSMVANASGIYYNNYVNSLYSKENGKLAMTGSPDLMGMYSAAGTGKVSAIITFLPLAMLYLVVIGVAYIAYKVWKKVNEDPEEVVATSVTEGDISLNIDEEITSDSANEKS